MNKATDNLTEIVNSLDINSLQNLEQMYDTFISNPQILNEKWISIFKNLSHEIPSSKDEIVMDAFTRGWAKTVAQSNAESDAELEQK